MHYIDAHFTRSWPLDKVTDARFVHRSCLPEIFSRHIGMTFTQYKQMLRVSKPREISPRPADLTVPVPRPGFSVSEPVRRRRIPGGDRPREPTHAQRSMKKARSFKKNHAFGRFPVLRPLFS